MVYTSAATPSYPLLVDTALYTSGSTISNVVISGNVSSGADVRWLVTDHLGTPCMIIEQTGKSGNWTESMSSAEDRWFEVWFDQGDDALPTWLLIVTPDTANPGKVLVYDPQENYRVVHQGQTYEDTMLWLQEDEYILVEGRVLL